MNRIAAALGEDLPQMLVDIDQLNQAIGRLIEFLKTAQRIKKPGAYLGAYQIACAWCDTIKEAPTLSRATLTLLPGRSRRIINLTSRRQPQVICLANGLSDAIRPHKKSRDREIYLLVDWPIFRIVMA
jgi:hypothetical protein